MNGSLRILLACALLPAAFASTAPASAAVCLPNSTRYTKCVDGAIFDCTKSRSIKCKRREECKRTDKTCDQFAR
jgi:hypothetical protein